MVFLERLFEYDLGDGWGLLCKFLGRLVFEVEFLRVNDVCMLRGVMMGKIKWNLGEVVRVLILWVVFVLVVGIGLWFFWIWVR